MASNHRILSTAALEEKLLAAAARHGITADAIPFIKAIPVTGKERDEWAPLATRAITAVFTSANAVTALAQVLAGRPQWHIYCIGQATRQAVLQYFDAAAIKGIADDSAALAQVIIGHRVPAVVFFCTAARLDSLPLALRQHGITVQEEVVYETIETPVLLHHKYDALLFFSPSGVDSYLRLNTIAPGIPLFAIGNSTAAALAARTQNKIVVSDTPSKEHLLNTVIQYFHSQGS